MTELATVKERQLDGSVRTYMDEDLKQEIALKLPVKLKSVGKNKKWCWIKEYDKIKS